MIEKCPICSHQRDFCFRAKVLRQHEIEYCYCNVCGLLQTESPFWLEEAYSEAIATIDTGIIQRNLLIAEKLACFLFFLLDKQGKYLDVGGGYGLLTRLMRDTGFDFYWSDPNCKNLFAQGFERSITNPPFTAITAFEVLEHVYQPIEFLQQVLQEAETKTIVLSTKLFKHPPPPPNSWWYYALESGQHISFYQNKTLRVMAEKLALSVYSYHDFHIFTDRSISPQTFRLLSSSISKLVHPIVKKQMKSKTVSDSEKLMNND